MYKNATNANTALTLVQRDGSGNFNANNINLASLTVSQAVVTDGSKNLASLAYGTASSASSLIERDSNQNAFATNFVDGGTRTTAASAITTLTAASNKIQILVGGTGSQTYQLPDASALPVGYGFIFENEATGTLTITYSDTTTLTTVPAGGKVLLTLVIPSALGGWGYNYLLASNTTSSSAAFVAGGSIASTTTLTSGTLFTAQAGQIVATRVVTGAGAVTVATTDYIVIVNKASGASTVANLPAAGSAAGQVYIIKDGKGDAATNNITLTPASGNIDGASTYVMNSNYQAITIVDNGTQYNII